MQENQRFFVENLWYAAAWEYEVAEADNKLARTICETPLVFYKAENLGYVALDDRCCHRAAPLSLGRVEGDCIRCMYHGMLYEPSGSVIEIPGQERISPLHKVRSYPVCAKGGMLWIWMGDPELAKESDIYDFEPLSDTENWRGFEKKAYLHYQANWLLIMDNLSDFSHVAFVHTNTLGGSENYAYESIPEKLTRLEDGFAIQRWHHNCDAPPFHGEVIPEQEQSAKLDRCNDVNMYLPGVFFMETLFAPVGWDKEKNDRGTCREYRNCQFMTPETRNTTHFFWDYMHNFDVKNSTISTSLKESLLKGFMEDKVFIEEQQKLLEQGSNFQARGIAADAALMHFRKIWKARLEEETSNSPTEFTQITNPIL